MLRQTLTPGQAVVSWCSTSCQVHGSSFAGGILIGCPGCSLKELASLFPQVLDVPSHLTRFLSFWDRVLTLARGHGEGAGAAVVDVGLFEEAGQLWRTCSDLVYACVLTACD